MRGLSMSSLKGHPALLPLFVCVGVGCAMSALYLTRLGTRSPDVMWNRKGGTARPWEEYASKNYKFMNTREEYKICSQLSLCIASRTYTPTTRYYDIEEDPPGKGPKKWLKHNDEVYPPQAPGEERRPAFVCHMKTNLKYSPWKMWYIASLIRGMSIDEAVKQLSFINKKGAGFIKDTLLEAQDMAVKEHNIEFKSNLWVADSHVTKGVVIKGMRRHARGRFGIVEYFHCHYFVRLEEGPPPVDYFQPKPTGPEMLEEWVADVCAHDGSLEDTVFVVILVRNKETILPYFLTSLDRLDYPKSRMSLWIRSDHCEDQTGYLLQLWINSRSHLYHSVHFRHSASPTSYPDELSAADWSNERFKHLIRLKEEAFLEARRAWADYVWFLDADVLISSPSVLKDLVAAKKPVVSPMLKSFGKYSNFWGAITPDWYYARSDDYMDILDRKKLGIFRVPLVHSCVLIDLRTRDSQKLAYDPEKLTELDIPFDDIIAFAASANQSNVEMFVTNEKQYGVIPLVADTGRSAEEEKDMMLYLKLMLTAITGEALSVSTVFDDESHKYKQQRGLPGIDKTYMINLLKRVERRDRMDYCFRELGIEYEWIEAVDGSTLTSEYLEKESILPFEGFRDPHGLRPITFGEVGCFLSHYEIWSDVVLKKYQMVAVFEDDIHFELSFMTKLQYALWEAKHLNLEWDLMYLGRKILRTNETWVPGSKTFVYPEYTYWTLSYLLTLEGAKKLLAADPLKNLLPVDEFLPIICSSSSSELFQRQPLLANGGYSLLNGSAGGSWIEGDGDTTRINIEDGSDEDASHENPTASLHLERSGTDVEDSGIFTGKKSRDFTGSWNQRDVTKVSLPAPTREEYKFPKDRFKTFVAGMFFVFCGTVNMVSLSIVHDKVPDREKGALPDIVLDNIRVNDWALYVAEYLLMILTYFCILISIFHKHRSITMFVTVLPVASKTYECNEKAAETSARLIFQRTFELLLGLGLSVNGRHKYCGDYIYSGHTMILVLGALVVKEYTPRRWWLLHWITAVWSFSGVVMILYSRGHYTVDVIIAYYITTRLFWTYHTFSNNVLPKWARTSNVPDADTISENLPLVKIPQSPALSRVDVDLEKNWILRHAERANTTGEMHESQSDVVAADLPKLFAIFDDIPNTAEKISANVECFNTTNARITGKYSKGLHFLSLKNALILDYLADVALVMLKKLDGRRLENDCAIDRIVEVRTYLEKMRPIERKMRYQIEKMIKASTTGQVDVNDPLLMKANPANLVSKVQNADMRNDDASDSDTDVEVDSKERNAVKKYVPPKLSAVPFGEPGKGREEKIAERSQKRMLNSAIMQELKAEYSEQPMEVFESGHGVRRSISTATKERIAYEEENFVRLSVSKKDKNVRKRAFSTIGQIGDEVTDFGFGFGSSSGGQGSGKRRKTKVKGGKISKKFKKGVLWKSGGPLPGASEAIRALSSFGKKIIYVTNNCTHTRAHYVKKLESMRFPVAEKSVFTPAYVAANYLKERKHVGKVYCIGTSAISEELEEVSIECFGYGKDDLAATTLEECYAETYHARLEEDVNAVIIGYDPFFSAMKILKAASYAERPGVLLLASCEDHRAPYDMPGKVIPCTGAFVAAVEKVAGRSAVILGKPSVHMYESIKLVHDFDPRRAIMIGDNCMTDVLFGKNCGIDTLLVLTGISTRTELSKYEETGKTDSIPTYYAASLSDVADALSSE
ncbi:unnamed protein product [Notodromas monacha]|uniref:Uncharacterized protein n=1 Tax=Notodromas monacha TaxID=399045 RepID=A0A7R9BF95_9CRUS|nr:unnamed protein product [Notodromas monacha]CAG0914322.1 unnamed protein product [Notodromas monacha]